MQSAPKQKYIQKDARNNINASRRLPLTAALRQWLDDAVRRGKPVIQVIICPARAKAYRSSFVVDYDPPTFNTLSLINEYFKGQSSLRATIDYLDITIAGINVHVVFDRYANKAWALNYFELRGNLIIARDPYEEDCGDPSKQEDWGDLSDEQAQAILAALEVESR